jgi:hypothetical protein
VLRGVGWGVLGDMVLNCEVYNMFMVLWCCIVMCGDGSHCVVVCCVVLCYIVC